MPTSFASSTYVDADTGFDSTSPIHYLKVDYTADGGISSVKVKTYSGHTGASNIRVTIGYRDIYANLPEDFGGLTEIDAASVIGEGTEDIGANLASAFDYTTYITPIYSIEGYLTTDTDTLQTINPEAVNDGGNVKTEGATQTATGAYQPFSWNAAGWWLAYVMYQDEKQAEQKKMS